MDNQHIASNLTVRVSHDLLQAGAMCRVSNELGVSEKHIQLLGECQALLPVPRAPSILSPPRPRRRLCRAALGWLSSVSFPPFLLFQWIPSGKVSLSVRTRVMLTSSLGRELGCWLCAASLAASLPAKPGGRWRLCPQRWESCLLVFSEAEVQPKPAGQGSRGMA